MWLARQPSGRQRPDDAIDGAFEIEFLVVGNCLLKKEDQNPELVQDYKDKYELD